MEVCRELFLSTRTACVKNPVVLLWSSVEEGKENRSQVRLEAGSSFPIIRAVGVCSLPGLTLWILTVPEGKTKQSLSPIR